MSNLAPSSRTTFIPGTGLAAEVRKLIAQGGPIRAGVAFWGKGAIAELGLAEAAGRDVKIVCDLMSGGCNPDEITKLLEIFVSENVLRRDGLHAKVWLADNAAIVDSSNASANGLGFEGSELAAAIEANVLVADMATLGSIRSWFDQNVLEGSQPITDPDLEIARELWRSRLKNRRCPTTVRSLLDALGNEAARNYLATLDIHVWVYEYTGRGPTADKILYSQRENRSDLSLNCWVNENLSAGAYVLDFDHQQNQAIFKGIFQVVDKDPLVQYNNVRILLCHRVSTIEEFDIGNVRIWEVAAAKAAGTECQSRNERWNLIDFYNEYLCN